MRRNVAKLLFILIVALFSGCLPFVYLSSEPEDLNTARLKALVGSKIDVIEQEFGLPAIRYRSTEGATIIYARSGYQRQFVIGGPLEAQVHICYRLEFDKNGQLREFGRTYTLFAPGTTPETSCRILYGNLISDANAQ